jgi:hypothetical protein
MVWACRSPGSALEQGDSGPDRPVPGASASESFPRVDLVSIWKSRRRAMPLRRRAMPLRRRAMPLLAQPSRSLRR